jgi:DNA repair protein RecO (recombination protein O)
MPEIRSDLPALVVDSYDYGESDKIVVFFCKEIGRISALAKGAHRSKKRFLNKLEIFSFVQITYSRSSPGRLAVLSDAELLNSFISLRSNLDGYKTASIIREYLLLATHDTSGDDHLFQLAVWALHSLNRNGDQRRILALFLIKFFDVLGYRPDLSTCQICSTRPPASEPVSFAVKSGGVICTRCSQASPRSEYRCLAAGTVQMISAVQQQPIARLSRFKPGGMVLEQILDYASRYGRHLFQREIQSWKLLDLDPGRRRNQSR